MRNIARDYTPSGMTFSETRSTIPSPPLSLREKEGGQVLITRQGNLDVLAAALHELRGNTRGLQQAQLVGVLLPLRPP